MKDSMIAAVRTGVQAIVGLLVSVPFIAGLDVARELESLLAAVAIAVVTLVLNWAQQRLPWLGKILSLGLSDSGPSYE